MTKMKTFSELNKLKTFKERYDYCRTAQLVGDITFGGSRWLNQVFYTSKEWKEFRNEIILRDKGCDLGIEGYDICGRIYIHHLNAITKEQLLSRDPLLLDPNNVVCCSFETHNAIHYGDESKLPIYELVERRPNDTIPWR